MAWQWNWGGVGGWGWAEMGIGGYFSVILVTARLMEHRGTILLMLHRFIRVENYSQSPFKLWPRAGGLRF